MDVNRSLSDIQHVLESKATVKDVEEKADRHEMQVCVCIYICVCVCVCACVCVCVCV